MTKSKSPNQTDREAAQAGVDVPVRARFGVGSDTDAFRDALCVRTAFPINPYLNPDIRNGNLRNTRMTGRSVGNPCS